MPRPEKMGESTGIFFHSASHLAQHWFTVSHKPFHIKLTFSQEGMAHKHDNPLLVSKHLDRVVKDAVSWEECLNKISKSMT